MTRKHISLKTKLAAALLQLREYGSDGQWLPIIDHTHAKQMTANQIISLFHWDHYPVPHAEGGPDEPWNLHAELIGAHREKTRKVDVPRIAKNKRIRKKEREHRFYVKTRWMTRAEIEREYPDTPLPLDDDQLQALPPPREIYAGVGRRMLRTLKSGGFDKTKSRGFDGKVKPRRKK